MKKKIFFVAFFAACLTGMSSCGSKSSNANSDVDTTMTELDSTSLDDSIATNSPLNETTAEESLESTEEEASSSESDSEDWDAILDEYEEYCDNLVSLSKKVKSGDVSAMSEYSEAMQQAKDLDEKLSNAKDNLSTSQQARLIKIASKMANASQAM